jgi:copper(I)-binding protein
MKLVAAVLTLFSLNAFAQVQIDNPWSRPTPAGAKAAAGYMVLKNQGAAPDRLVSATSPAAERVETHVTVRDGDIMRMREVKGYDIPAKGSFELKPAGPHLMLINLKAPIKAGDRVPVVLRFERAGEVKIELVAGHQPASPTKDSGHHKHH